MTEKKALGERGAEPKKADIVGDESMAAMVSAYLDGELKGEDLAEFESLLKSNPTLAREVQDMRSIESRLIEMGADILSEPLPDAMLKAFTKIDRG